MKKASPELKPMQGVHRPEGSVNWHYQKKFPKDLQGHPQASGSSAPASSQPRSRASAASSYSLSRPMRPVRAISRTMSPARRRTSACRKLEHLDPSATHGHHPPEQRPGR
jgi:hypothetical protein